MGPEEVKLFVHWRVIPSGYSKNPSGADVWRLTVMPAFHFETCRTQPLPPRFVEMLCAWPEQFFKREFRVHLASACEVPGIEETDETHSTTASFRVERLESTGNVQGPLGRKIMRRALANATVYAEEGVTCVELLNGRRSKLPRIRAFKEMAQSTETASLFKGVVDTHAALLVAPFVAIRESKASDRLLIAAPHLTGDQFAGVFEDADVFTAPDAPLAERMENDALRKVVGPEKSDSRVLRQWWRDLKRLQGEAWSETLTPSAIRGLGAIAWSVTLRDGDAAAEPVMVTLENAWWRSQQAGGSPAIYDQALRTAATAHGQTPDFFREIVRLRVRNANTAVNEHDWKTSVIGRKARWDQYLNLMRYLVANYHEHAEDCSDARMKDDQFYDINNRLAELAAWPTIAQLTGLSFDIECRVADLVVQKPPGPAPAVRVWPARSAERIAESEREVFYWTAYQSEANGIDFGWPRETPKCEGGKPIFAANPAQEIVRGTLNLPKRHRLRSIDVDAAIRGAVYQKHAVDTQTSAGVNKNSIAVQHSGYSCGGIALVATEVAEEAADSQQSFAKQEAQFGTKYSILIGANDLAVGYRIDVNRVSRRSGDKEIKLNSRWLSTCSREVKYDFSAKFADNFSQAELDRFAALQRTMDLAREREEGFIRNVCRESKPEGANGDETEIFPGTILCVWRDRNLAVPDDEQATQDPFPNVTKSTIDGQSDLAPFTPKPHLPPNRTETRLRFGSRYFFGARVVYASGASISVIQAAHAYDGNERTRLGSSERRDASESPFLFDNEERYPPPVLHLESRIMPGTTPGDEIETLVLRTGPDVPDDDLTTRWIVAPRTTAEMAELAGALDCMEDLPDGALTRFKLNADGNVPKVLDLGPCDSSSDQHCYDTLLKAGSPPPDAVPYYPNPATQSFLMALVDDEFSTHVDKRQLMKVRWYGTRRHWPDAPAVKFEARAVDSGPVVIRADGVIQDDRTAENLNKLTISMPPASRALMRLWSVSNQDPNFRPCNATRAILQQHASTLGPAIQPAFGLLSSYRREDTGDLSHPSSNPVRHVRVIHAVQKPLSAPRFGEDFTARRFPILAQGAAAELPPDAPWDRRRTELGAIPNAALLEGTLLVDRKSTGRIDIFSERDDWVDDPAKRDAPYSMHVTEQLRPIEPIDNSENRIDPVSVQIDDAGEERNVWQELNDTKHHLITYRLRAHSAFVHLFPMARNGRPIDFTRSSDEVDRAGRKVRILSTQRPALPKIVSVVPTFAHTPEYASGAATLKRRSGLRIWLDRPWFSSGNDEKLAVICAPSSLFPRSLRSNGEDAPPRFNRWNLCDVDHAMHPFITQIGLDPTFTTGELIDVLPPNAFTAGSDSRPVATDGDLLLAEVDESKGTPLRVSAAIFDIGEGNYDRERRQYSVDIGINLPALAWEPEKIGFRPFIRLALARYQQHSLRDCELSGVVIADLVQLQPNRVLSVRYDAAKRDVIDVELFGYGSTEHVESQDPPPGPLRRFLVNVELLERKVSEAFWRVVQSDTVGVDKVGDGYSARARFLVPFGSRDRHFAVRIEELLTAKSKGAIDIDWKTPFAAPGQISQPVMFMLQPLVAASVLPELVE
jgi:hypothetical protein